jgi:hypothetical protein
MVTTEEKLGTLRKMREQIADGHWIKGTYYTVDEQAGDWRGCLRGNIAKAHQREGEALSGVATRTRGVEHALMKDLSADPVVVEWFGPIQRTHPELSPPFVAEHWNDSSMGADIDDVLHLLDRQEARYLEMLAGDAHADGLAQVKVQERRDAEVRETVVA